LASVDFGKRTELDIEFHDDAAVLIGRAAIADVPFPRSG